MAGKARVHQLAKELGVTSKEVLAKLAAQGERVKSASSTVEAPVARRLREAYGVPHPVPRAAGAKGQRPEEGTIPTPLDVARGKAQRQPIAGASTTQPKVPGGSRQSSLLNSADALEIYKRHRLISASANPGRGVNELFREYETRYGISRSALRQLVASDKLRRLADSETKGVSDKDGGRRNLRDAKPSAAMQVRKPEPQADGYAEGAMRATPTRPITISDKGKRRKDPITPAVAFDMYERYRRASANEKDALVRECETKYGLTRKELRRIVAAVEQRGSSKELNLRTRRNTDLGARNRKTQQIPQEASSARSTADCEVPVTTRPRKRTPNLPPVGATMNLQAMADIVVANSAYVPDRTVIDTCLQQLAPSSPDRYGYLTWRYAATRAGHGEDRLTAEHQDLIALASVIDQEKQLLDALIRQHGSVLTNPDLADRVLDKEFRKLASGTDRRSAADELQRTRESYDFLRCAVVLTIASPGNGQRLWDMLGQLHPPTSGDLADISPQLERARRRLADFNGTVHRLLATDDPNLTRFLRQSRVHLVSLQLKHYDFLRPFRRSAAGMKAIARQARPDLAFQVLPQGEQLQRFLGEIRASKQYSGYRVDEHRLTVLEDLQKHFGAQRCVWHRGSDSADGIGIRYLVLAIKTADGSDENAVAISPLAGRHATYVVRRECAKADWKTLFAHPKFEARLLGARKLLFTASPGHADQYSAMRDKIIKLLECHPREFR